MSIFQLPSADRQMYRGDPVYKTSCRSSAHGAAELLPHDIQLPEAARHTDTM